MTRFRGEQNLQFQCMLANVERYRDKGKVRHKSYFSVLEFVCSLSTPEEVRKGLLTAFQSSKKFLCVNDDIQDPLYLSMEKLYMHFSRLWWGMMSQRMWRYLKEGGAILTSLANEEDHVLCYVRGSIDNKRQQ